MTRDLLLLLEPGFTDPAHPGDRFVCPHGVALEFRQLASSPALDAAEEAAITQLVRTLTGDRQQREVATALRPNCSRRRAFRPLYVARVTSR
ncbi:DUF3088 family protein [Paraburkholderia sediminicola]